MDSLDCLKSQRSRSRVGEALEESGEELEKSLERRGVGEMSWRKVREIVEG